MYQVSRVAQQLAVGFMARNGQQLTKRFGNNRVADWLRNYALFFNTEGASVLFPDAPWFNTYDPAEEEDCINHPANTDPVGYYTVRGTVLWWQRPGRMFDATKRQAVSIYRGLRRWMVKNPAPQPAVELDPYRCSED